MSNYLVLLKVGLSVRYGWHCFQNDVFFLFFPLNVKRYYNVVEVPAGRAEHLLPEVCPVDAAGTLPGPAAAGVFCQRGGRGHEGDLRLHGRPVSCAR